MRKEMFFKSYFNYNSSSIVHIHTVSSTPSKLAINISYEC